MAFSQDQISSSLRTHRSSEDQLACFAVEQEHPKLHALGKIGPKARVQHQVPSCNTTLSLITLPHFLPMYPYLIIHSPITLPRSSPLLSLPSTPSPFPLASPFPPPFPPAFSCRGCMCTCAHAYCSTPAILLAKSWSIYLPAILLAKSRLFPPIVCATASTKTWMVGSGR